MTAEAPAGYSKQVRTRPAWCQSCIEHTWPEEHAHADQHRSMPYSPGLLGDAGNTMSATVVVMAEDSDDAVGPGVPMRPYLTLKVTNHEISCCSHGGAQRAEIQLTPEEARRLIRCLEFGLSDIAEGLNIA